MTADKVRLVYDRSQSTARIVVRSKEDLETPLVSITTPSGAGYLAHNLRYHRI